MMYEMQVSAKGQVIIPGSLERVVFISGSAPAVYAAQSLILERMPDLRLCAVVLLTK